MYLSLRGFMKNNQVPTLVLDRLILRQFELSDSKEVQRQAGNPKVAEMTATVPHPYLDGLAEEWISMHSDWFNKGSAVTWAIELKDEKKLIGCMSLGINKSCNRAEITYWLGEEFWKQGFGTEAAIGAIRYGFEFLKLNKITSRHMSKNPSSGRIMIKAGMEKEGLLKQDFFKDGEYIDMVVYGLLRENFK